MVLCAVYVRVAGLSEQSNHTRKCISFRNRMSKTQDTINLSEPLIVCLSQISSALRLHSETGRNIRFRPPSCVDSDVGRGLRGPETCAVLQYS